MKLFGMILVVVVLLSGVAFADVSNWKTANQGTVAWDPVTTLVDGSPFPAGDQISYALYTRSVPQGVVSQAGTVSATQAVLTFAIEGRYVVGLKSVRSNGAGVQLSESVVVWSDDSLVCQNGQTFGFVFFAAPGNPGGLR